MRSISLITLAAALAVATTACTQNQAEVEVAVGVSVCPPAPAATCVVLPVPDAEVVISSDGRQLAHGKTDGSGRYFLSLTQVGEMDVVARSEVFDGGFSEGNLTIPSTGGRTVTDVVGRLAPGTR